LPLIVLLRLAVLLHRGARPALLPDIRLKRARAQSRMSFPRGWLRRTR
jgi:hypothetical protein